MPRAATRIARRLPAHPPSLRPHPAPCSCGGPVVPGGARRPARRLATAFDFEQAVERRTIDEASLKWGRYRRPYLSPGDPSPAPSLDDEVLPMWVADMDIRAPPCVVSALESRVAGGMFGYTAPSGRLKQSVVSYLGRRQGWGVEPNWLVFVNGLVPALNLFCDIAGERGDAMIVPTPVYPPFLAAPGNTGRRLASVPLLPPTEGPADSSGAESGWRLDWAAMHAAATARYPDGGRARAVLLCSPHNPTGHVFSASELRKLDDFCAEHDLLLCSDEIHADLLLEPGASHTPAASVSDRLAARTVTLFAASKTFNIPGLCAAFAVIPDPKLRLRFKRAMSGLITEVPCLGLTATEAAFDHGEPWRAALIEHLRGNRDLLYHTIRTHPTLRDRLRLYGPPQAATYLAWIDASALGLGSNAALDRLFREHFVGLSDGGYFGREGEGEGHVRLNFGCPRWRLEEGLRRIERAVASVS